MTRVDLWRGSRCYFVALGLRSNDVTTQADRPPWIYRVVPAFDSLRRYGLHDARADLIAGLTVAAVAVPQAMAYALVAGLPPEYGLYTAIVMTAVGALFDSSRQLINGPTNAISIAVLSVLGIVRAWTRRSRRRSCWRSWWASIQLGITCCGSAT